MCALSSSICPRHRHLATKAVDTAQPTSTEPLDKEEPGLLTRFWRWLNDEEEEYVSVTPCVLLALMLVLLIHRLDCSSLNSFYEVFNSLRQVMTETERKEREEMLERVSSL